MEYSEYAAIKERLKAELEEAQNNYNIFMKQLEDRYVGDFKLGSAVRVKNRPNCKGQKFHVINVTIYPKSTSICIRKAKKDGSPSINGGCLYYVPIEELEVWNEL